MRGQRPTYVMFFEISTRVATRQLCITIVQKESCSTTCRWRSRALGANFGISLTVSASDLKAQSKHAYDSMLTLVTHTRFKWPWVQKVCLWRKINNISRAPFPTQKILSSSCLIGSQRPNYILPCDKVEGSPSDTKLHMKTTCEAKHPPKLSFCPRLHSKRSLVTITFKMGETIDWG